MKLRMIYIILMTLAVQAPVWAVNASDDSTESMAIEKLEAVLPKIADKPGTRRALTLRLADLYSERARVRALGADTPSCVNCSENAKQDRLKALDYYARVFKGADKEQKARVLMQTAHLYRLTGQPEKANTLYNQVVREGASRHSASLVGLAEAGLGEVEYRKENFKVASRHFERALSNRATENRGFITYRLAWCYLNQGLTGKAKSTLVSILRSPELLESRTTEGETLDSSFHQDVARDLATFIARGPFGENDIALLIELSPEDHRRSNIFYLGTEADRLGNKNGARLAWGEYAKLGDVAPSESLEITIRLSQLNLDQGRKAEAISGLETFNKKWSADACKEADQCEELQTRFRNLVINWNKLEKKKPSPELLKAYGIYVNTFATDAEMIYWAAQLARQMREPRIAAELYKKAANAALTQTQDPKLDTDKLTKAKKALEGALVSGIEMAEAAKDPKLRAEAYDRYLSMNPTGAKQFEVRYQRAHLGYELGKYKEAAEAFHALALSPDQGSEGLKNKAADLALDSLALLKDDLTLQSWSKEFADRFANRRLEFVKIGRTAAVNHTAAITNRSQNEDDLKSALKNLQTVSLVGASSDEKVVYYRNQILLSEKAKDLNGVRNGVAGLLSIPKLKAADREFAYSYKLWLAEVELNFGEAFRVAQQMRMNGVGEEKRLLRMGLLAELAGENPKPYYDRYLKISRNAAARVTVLAKRIRLESNPGRMLRSHLRELKSNPETLSSLALEIFAKTKDYNLAKDILRTRGISETAAGRTLARLVFIKDYLALAERTARHRIHGQSEALLQKTLGQRIDFLKQIDQSASSALRSGDWSSQVIALSFLSQENYRLYREVTALPTPRRLKKSERAQYEALLARQVAPFNERAKSADQKVQELWSQKEVLNRLLGDYQTLGRELSGLVADELRALSKVAPSSIHNRIASTLSESRGVSQAKVLQAKKALQQDPFSVEKINDLRQLELSRGSGPMVVFLEARLSEVKNGGVKQ